MATREDIYAAIKNADAAGDSESVQKLGAYLQTMSSEAPILAPSASASPSYLDRVKANMLGTGQAFNEALVNGARHAGQIGATLLAPTDYVYDKVTGHQGTNADRRKSINDFQTENFDPNSFAAKQGGLAVDIAGTAGVGGSLGQLAKVAGASTPIVNALASSGFTTGARVAPNLLARGVDLGTRAAGGAITGGASMGLIDPEHAGPGALIGGALPPALAAAGKAGGALVRGVSTATQPRAVSAAEDLLKALDAASPEQRAAVLKQLQSAPTLVPGASPTVAQALQSPQAGIVQRVVYDSPGGGALRQKIAQQGEARVSALEGVASTSANGPAMAREDLGQSVARNVIPARAAEKSRIGSLYEAVDPQSQARLQLPLDQMQAATDKYLGPGTFGQGRGAADALSTAKQIGMEAKPGSNPVAVDWRTLQNFRSSVGDAAAAAEAKGATQDAAALRAMQSALGRRVDEAGGQGLLKAGESMPLDVYARWTDANSAHAAMKARYDTGPLAGIFRKGPNGEPALQGGEIAFRAWGARPGLADDVKSFKRLVGENPNLMGQFKSMVTTEGAATADAAGNLTTKFSKWVKQTLPGLKEAFNPNEVETLKRIAQDIDRHASAVKAGTSLGGSNTYQNAANALDLGVLDSPVLSKAASMIPGIKYAAAPALEGVRGFARNAKANRLAELLADSGTAANALNQLSERQPNALASRVTNLNALVAPSLYRGAPRADRR